MSLGAANVATQTEVANGAEILLFEQGSVTKSRLQSRRYHLVENDANGVIQLRMQRAVLRPTTCTAKVSQWLTHSEQSLAC